MDAKEQVEALRREAAVLDRRDFPVPVSTFDPHPEHEDDSTAHDVKVVNVHGREMMLHWRPLARFVAAAMNHVPALLELLAKHEAGLQTLWEASGALNARGFGVTLVEVIQQLRFERNDALETLKRIKAHFGRVEDLPPMVELAAPTAIGSNVLEYAAPGPVGLTAAQREDIRRELTAVAQLRGEVAQITAAYARSREEASRLRTRLGWAQQVLGLASRENAMAVKRGLGAWVGTTLQKSIDDILAGVDPSDQPDMGLLAALANGDGGQRTGLLKKLGYLQWHVTAAGKAALQAFVDSKTG